MNSLHRFPLRRPLATLRMSCREMGYFGLMNLVGGYLLRLVRLLVMLMVWRALFLQGADLEGMSLQQMLLYTLLSSALEPLLDVRTPASSWLHEGAIVSLYQRPMGIFSQLAAQTMGGWVMPLILFGLPVVLCAPLLGVALAPPSGWALLSLALSVSQGFAVDFLFACLIIRVKNMTWTVQSLRQALTALLTGALIPFSVLPWNLGSLLAYSPLGTLAGAPLSLFCGLDAASRVIPAQLIWNATLWPLALWGFRRSRERMVSYGG